jgi:WD40 repeat protein
MQDADESDDKIGYGDLLPVVVDKYHEYPVLPQIRERTAALLTMLANSDLVRRDHETPAGTTFTDILALLTNWPVGGRRLLLYWAGHGETQGDGRFYLLCTDSRKNALAASAVSGQMLGELLAEAPYQEVVVVVDSCHGGGGSQEIVAAYRKVIERRRYPRGTSRGIAVISSAGRFQHAREAAFSSALSQVLTDGAESSEQWLGWTDRDSHVSPSDLVRAVREKLESAGLSQLPELDMFGSIGRFFPNPRFRRHGPAETDRRTAALNDFLSSYESAHHDADRPWVFFGREITLSRITSWAATTSGGLLLVTGSPGSGKSAVSRELVGRALRARSATGPVADQRPAVLSAVNLSGKSLLDLVRELAQVLRPEEISGDEADAGSVVQWAADRHDDGLVLVDALDEAYEPDLVEIVNTVLRPLAQAGVNVLVSSRAHGGTGTGPGDPPGVTTAGLLRPETVVRLEEDPLGEVAITEFVEHRLATAPGSPYAEDRVGARALAAVVAARSRGIFLLARVFTDTMVTSPLRLTVTSPELDDLLGADLGAAFDADLRRFGDRATTVQDLLRPLAWAQGRGLPSRDVWLPLANALAEDDTGYTEADLAWTVYHAGDYLVERSDRGQTVYRPYHEEFASYLRSRSPLTAEQAQVVVTETLVALAGAASNGSWGSANSYIREHLPTHAAAAKRLPVLAADSEFFIHCDQYKIAKVIGSIDLQRSPLARVWCEANDRMDNEGPDRRAALMQAAALLDEPEALPLLDTARDLPWAGRWSRRATPSDNTRQRATPFTVGRGLVVTGRGTVAEVHDLVIGRLVRRLTGHRGTIQAVAVGEVDGRPVAVTAADDDVRIWDLAEDSTARALLGFAGRADALATGDIGGIPVVLTAGSTGEMRIWDLGTGATVNTLTGRHGPIRAVAVAEVDGTPVVVSAGDGHPAILVQDAGTGATIRTLAGHDGRIRCATTAEYAGEPMLITAGDDGNARCWSLRSGAELHQFDHSPGRVVSATLLAAFGSLLLATGTEDGHIRFWNALTGRLAGGTWRGFIDRTATTGFVVCIGVSPHGEPRLMATGNDDGLVRFWDLDSGLYAGALPAHRGWVRSLAIGVLGGREVLATAGYDETCRLWDLRDRKLTAELRGHRGWIYSVCTGTVNGREVVATAAEDATIRLWDPASGAELSRLQGHTGWIRHVSLGEIGGRSVVVSASDDGTARIWDPDSGTALLTVAGHENWIVAAALAEVSGRPVLATAGDDGVVRTWDAVTGAAIAAITEHSAWTSSVALGKVDGRWLLASGSDDRTAGLWDPLTGGLIHRFAQPHWCGFVTFGVYQGRDCLLTAGDEFSVRVWDIQNGGLLDVIGKAPRGPHRVALTEQAGRVYLTTTDDHITQMIELLRAPE